MHADLERVHDAHRRRAVRHYLHKELEEQKDFLLGLDCGSSGTKFMVYRLDSATCPDTASACKDKVMKVTPNFKQITKTDVHIYFSLWCTKIAPHFGGASSFEGFVAKATGGNRIISQAQNTSIWDRFTASSTGFSGFSGVPVVGGFGDPSTMSGTMEAWLEWKAAVKLGHNGNFVSLGGASAQMAFKLTTLALATRFRDLFSAMTKTGLPCNNQQDYSDYYCVVEADPSVFRCLSNDEIEEKCDGDKCVGLISWLAGENQDTDRPGCTPGSHHRTGGTDEVKANFLDWVQGDGSAHATACNEGSVITDCVAAIEAFIAGDALLKTVNDFTTIYKAAVPTAKWYAAGKMDEALHVEGVNPEVRDPSDDTIKAERGAFFYSNAQSIVNKAGVASDIVRPSGTIDWLDAAAGILGYNNKCDLPRIAPTVSKCVAAAA